MLFIKDHIDKASSIALRREGVFMVSLSIWRVDTNHLSVQAILDLLL